jgi:hypothetical protein
MFANRFVVNSVAAIGAYHFLPKKGSIGSPFETDLHNLTVISAI